MASALTSIAAHGPASSSRKLNPGVTRLRTHVTDKAIEIDEKVQFELGMATILPASDALLNEIVDDLRQHPEIVELAIEGHASSDGDPENNRELSQKRAEAKEKRST